MCWAHLARVWMHNWGRVTLPPWPWLCRSPGSAFPSGKGSQTGFQTGLWGNQSCHLHLLQKAEEDEGFQVVSFPILKNPQSDVLFPPFPLTCLLHSGSWNLFYFYQGYSSNRHVHAVYWSTSKHSRYVAETERVLISGSLRSLYTQLKLRLDVCSSVCSKTVTMGHDQ